MNGSQQTMPASPAGQQRQQAAANDRTPPAPPENAAPQKPKAPRVVFDDWAVI